jgi:hypothetical protein
MEKGVKKGEPLFLPQVPPSDNDGTIFSETSFFSQLER